MSTTGTPSNSIVRANAASTAAFVTVPEATPLWFETKKSSWPSAIHLSSTALRPGKISTSSGSRGKISPLPLRRSDEGQHRRAETEGDVEGAEDAVMRGHGGGMIGPNLSP